MKTKDEIKKLFEKIDENKESLLVIHIDKDEHMGGFVAGDDREISAAIATLLNDGYGDDAENGVERLAKSIIKGVGAVIAIPSPSGIAIAHAILGFVKVAAKNARKGIFSILDALKDEFSIDDVDDVDDDDDDDDEDCETCENNKTCPLPQAIKYRKANGIPAPRKNRKGRKSEKKHAN